MTEKQQIEIIQWAHKSGFVTTENVVCPPSTVVLNKRNLYISIADDKDYFELVSVHQNNEKCSKMHIDVNDAHNLSHFVMCIIRHTIENQD